MAQNRKILCLRHLFVLCGLLHPATSSADSPWHRVELSSVAMRRNASLTYALADLADTAADALLDHVSREALRRDDWTGRFGRLVKLWVVDMPLASLAQVANHEFGHATRIDESGIGHTIRIARLPWPTPFTAAHVRPDRAPPTDRTLAMLGGGIEASHELADQITRRLYTSTGPVRYFDLMLLVSTKLDSTAYALVDVRGKYLDNRFAFFADDPGDPRQYAAEWAFLRQGENGGFQAIRTAALEIRRGALLNLLDYALLGNLRVVVDEYIVHGRRLVRPASLRVRNVWIVPRIKYSLSPRGPEYMARVELGGRRFSSSVQTRWTEKLNGRRLFGVGTDLTRTFDRVSARLLLDVWKDTDGRPGGRTEAGVEILRSSLTLSAAVGAKSSGHLPAYPLKSTVYASVALAKRF